MQTVENYTEQIQKLQTITFPFSLFFIISVVTFKKIMLK